MTRYFLSITDSNGHHRLPKKIKRTNTKTSREEEQVPNWLREYETNAKRHASAKPRERAHLREIWANWAARSRYFPSVVGGTFRCGRQKFQHAEFAGSSRVTELASVEQFSAPVRAHHRLQRSTSTHNPLGVCSLYVTGALPHTEKNFHFHIPHNKVGKNVQEKKKNLKTCTFELWKFSIQ